MKLTLNRVKELQPSKIIDGVINCKDKEEAEDVLIAAACWLAHTDFQATPKSMKELEQAYLESIGLDSLFPMDTD